VRRIALATLLVAACAPAAQAEAPPSLDEPIPGTPAALSERVAQTSRELAREIDAFSDHTRETPPALSRWALYQQRVYRLLARDGGLARATLARLPRSVAAGARDSVAALRELFALTPPTRRRRFRTGPALPAGVLRDYYGEAERRFGVGWHVLAAVNMVETQFNRLRSDSTAGAQGPMQFLPATWRAYGLGGNVHDPHDAILGAASYLRASAAPRSYRRALYAYNHSSGYARAVLRLARRMARSPRAYVAYHAWQAFVRTRRATGGSRPHSRDQRLSVALRTARDEPEASAAVRTSFTRTRRRRRSFRFALLVKRATTFVLSPALAAANPRPTVTGARAARRSFPAVAPSIWSSSARKQSALHSAAAVTPRRSAVPRSARDRAERLTSGPRVAPAPPPAASGPQSGSAPPAARSAGSGGQLLGKPSARITKMAWFPPPVCSNASAAPSGLQVGLLCSPEPGRIVQKAPGTPSGGGPLSRNEIEFRAGAEHERGPVLPDRWNGREAGLVGARGEPGAARAAAHVDELDMVAASHQQLRRAGPLRRLAVPVEANRVDGPIARRRAHDYAHLAAAAVAHRLDGICHEARIRRDVDVGDPPPAHVGLNPAASGRPARSNVRIESSWAQ
jgi:membrane-bound lytic murein transglycosylase B